METILRTNLLSKDYGKSRVLNNVSINLNEGDIYGLIGKNGAGKTTLFKLIMGLSEKTEGKVEIFGKTDNRGLIHARKNIGFMMNANFYPYLTAKDNLLYLCKIRGIVDSEDEVIRVLKLVDMHNVKKPFKTFSTGMKQRIGIASALLGKPKIVILDEPTNGLDPEGIADFRKLVKKLNKEEKITFIISSHILGELSLLATNFGFINNGKLLEEITIKELHSKTRSALTIEVSDVKIATTILEKDLKITNYKVVSDSETVVYEQLEKASQINEKLVNKKLSVSKLMPQETTLEDYFFELIGGLHD